MHWRNSNFQILSFLVGKCRTPDEAYRVLLELREERDGALISAKVSLIKLLAKEAKTKAPWRKIIPWLRLEDEAEMLSVKLNAPVTQQCIDQAEREVAFIDRLIERIKPYREYGHLPDHEAFQACQQKEWLEVLKSRAESMLASQGQISWDHLETMRVHPDFQTVLLPHINKVSDDIKNNNFHLTAPATQFLLEDKAS